MEDGGLLASWANTTSSGVIPNSSATSLMVGSRPMVLDSSSLTLRTLLASSFRERLTFKVPSSRRNRWISPMIMGTA
ncbi:hypothetical protein D3C81_2139710 [compost metagenome]